MYHNENISLCMDIKATFYQHRVILKFMNKFINTHINFTIHINL